MIVDVWSRLQRILYALYDAAFRRFLRAAGRHDRYGVEPTFPVRVRVTGWKHATPGRYPVDE